jgi:alkylation response protein AidB-like acyl-CoA dehydrogenase
MDLTFTPEEQSFRDEVRAFLDRNLPPAMRHKVLEGLHVPPEDTVEWQRILFRKGWGGPNWPTAFGGTGWDPVRQFIFEEECAAAGTPRLLPFGLKMVGPVIQRSGTPRSTRASCPASSPARTGGARATPSPNRVPTWRRCGPWPSGRGTTTS